MSRKSSRDCGVLMSRRKLKMIKRAAEQEALRFEISWDKFDEDTGHRSYFLETLQRSTSTLEALESLYGVFIRLKPNVEDDGGYKWTREEIDNYLQVLEEELFGVYQLQSLLDRYLLIENTLNQSPLTDEGGQYRLDI